MTRTAANRRPGVSLTEVLVAMFLMALGMIAILTLFPLGAMQVGQALRDDRCAQTALQADAYMRSVWRSEVVAQEGTPAGVQEQFYWAMDDAASNTKTAGPYTTGPSFAVLIDPLRFAYSTGASQTSVATGTGGSDNKIQRRTVEAARTATNPKAAAYQIAGMTDDLSFEMNGAPVDAGGGAVTRQGRYTWAALVQRPDNTRRTTANLTILVFDGRPLLPVANDEKCWAIGCVQNLGERQLANVEFVTATPGIDSPQLVRRGGWVLDGTADTSTKPESRNAYFYRIAGYTEAATNKFALDLETPLKAPFGQSDAAYLGGAKPVVNLDPKTKMYFFAGLAEVFVRPQLRPDPAD